ncbi:DUF599 domain-containing protein [Ruegeria hyattellae]|uniref:DUF599 domain-containing protein n=1 Tax=Ruegeria hyattellae TaxID=3233337 RepID=UPI00355B4801
MSWIDRASLFAPLDYGAVALLVAGWLWIGWRIEKSDSKRPSVSCLMAGFRREWMTQMVTREPRVLDSQLIGQLRQGTTFFASASMIAIGGGLALVGNTDRLAGVAQELAIGDAPAFVWELKIICVLLFLSNAFLKYVWAHRLFGYCAVIMGAVPNDPKAANAYPRALQAAELSTTAARSFNRAMRSTYFALTAVAWMLGPAALILASVITLAMLYRREFASYSREILLNPPADTQT